MEAGYLHRLRSELTFAQQIRETLPDRSRKDLRSANEIMPIMVIEKGRGGSTDVGDVGCVVPTAGLSTATWFPGTSPHTGQAIAAGGMPIGHKGMILAAKTLAGTARDLERRTGSDFIYSGLPGDREPPLDDRK